MEAAGASAVAERQCHVFLTHDSYRQVACHGEDNWLDGRRVDMFDLFLPSPASLATAVNVQLQPTDAVEENPAKQIEAISSNELQHFLV